MEEPADKTPPIFAVVCSHELEAYTSRGWVLRETLTEDEVTPLDEPMTAEQLTAQTTSHNGAYQTNQYGLQSYNHATNETLNPAFRFGIPAGYLRRFVLARVVKFVMERNDVSRLYVLNGELDVEKQKVRDLESAVRAMKTEIENAKKAEVAIAKLEENLRHANEAKAEEVRLRIAEKNAHRQLESDFGKLRDQFGALRVKEILSGGK